MMDMMWVYAIILLTLPEGWGQEPAFSLSESNQIITSTASPSVYVVRHVMFNHGSDVNLTCSNKTWKDIMFVTWKIKLINPECIIAFQPGGTSVDTCNDGKSLQNTSSFQSYLNIPNFSKTDEGVYNCQSAYLGGVADVMFNVTMTVPPIVFVWLEHGYNQVVAVCRAEGGNPTANITWLYAGNSSTVETKDSSGLFTAESRVLLLEGMHPGDLSCVIRHPCWEEDKILIPEISEVSTDHWFYIRIVLVIALILSGFVFFIIMKLRRGHQQSDI